MKLSDYARDITKKADCEGYAADKSRASDPLIKPFADCDSQKTRLKALQESTIGLCWIDAKGKAIPYYAGEFARVQVEIQRLQSVIDHNAAVLTELEDKVRNLGLSDDQFSIARIYGEKSKILERITQIKAEQEEALAQKRHSVINIGGNRAMFEDLPEVKAARQKTTELIEPLEAEITVLDGKILGLEFILRKLKR